MFRNDLHPLSTPIHKYKNLFLGLLLVFMAVFLVVAGIAVHTAWKACREYEAWQESSLPVAETFIIPNGASSEAASVPKTQPEAAHEENPSPSSTAGASEPAAAVPQTETAQAESSVIANPSGNQGTQNIPSAVQGQNAASASAINNAQNVSSQPPSEKFLADSGGASPAPQSSPAPEKESAPQDVPSVLQPLPTLNGGSEVRSTLNPVPIPPVNVDNAPLAPLSGTASAELPVTPPAGSPQASATPPDKQTTPQTGASTLGDVDATPSSREPSASADAPSDVTNATPARDEKAAEPNVAEPGIAKESVAKAPSASKAPRADNTPGKKAPAGTAARTWTSLECEDGQIVFRISGKPALKGESFALRNPNRVVLDLEGHWRVRPPKPDDKSFLVGIRYAIHSADKTRIVLDLARVPKSWKTRQIGADTIELLVR